MPIQDGLQNMPLSTGWVVLERSIQDGWHKKVKSQERIPNSANKNVFVMQKIGSQDIFHNVSDSY